ncbi:CpsD/CapB family tyrosine-protein kinase [Alicyclobacillus hesperidum]|uniref:CpsD/CapB family tyrosine-protein kinase n=1 Tax=Alicyclobacillus hesperidum TaxID=89784 RepID=UPI000945A5D7|nr:CpsD/CapB family tyrosine-protein kinase [Alicyclobacillus hesperidum]
MRSLASREDIQRPISLINPKSPLTESYRTLRTNIQFASVAEDTKVVLVTSTAPGEGKTSTSTNLAVVAAAANKKVLLIDADMRKPQVHQRFQVSNLIGLSTLLIKERSLQDCIVSSGAENLYLLTSGPIPPNPAEMLASRAFAELVDVLRSQFDMIVIDSPPVLSVSDTLALSHIADGVLFVVDSQKTHRLHAKRAVQALMQVEARILGVVLNRVKHNKKDSYYYSYYTAGTPVTS